ncbi:hypothetical protein CMUS01_07768 [Colletotrichum musicola]|uniref:Uncharacterized protein n=1 Tax=Colletotrichum musicola TaxID=2175873 RepID=A0A8H6NEG8_9PEZI|nr:hypothetical protein CMUS01_07768 [Colletotrichum musicola]
MPRHGSGQREDGQESGLIKEACGVNTLMAKALPIKLDGNPGDIDVMGWDPVTTVPSHGYVENLKPINGRDDHPAEKQFDGTVIVKATGW